MEIALHKTFIRMKNWSEYQHYKDRSAPWIKLHKELLSSHFWIMGSDASKLLAICIMLLAQRTDNKIPMDSEYIKRFGHLESNPDLNPLIESQLIEFIDDLDEVQDASNVLAMCYPEERERRIEEREKKQAPEKPPAFVLPDWIDSEKWALWMKTRKKKMIPDQMQAQVNKLKKWRDSGLDFAKSLSDAADAGWQGLVEPTNARASPSQSIHEKRAHTIAYLTGAIKDEQERDITGESSRIYENS